MNTAQVIDINGEQAVKLPQEFRAIMRNKPAVVSRLASVLPSVCSISSVTAYELYTGVEKCTEPVREQSKVTRLLSTVSVAPFDLAAGRPD